MSAQSQVQGLATPAAVVTHYIDGRPVPAGAAPLVAP